MKVAFNSVEKRKLLLKFNSANQKKKLKEVAKIKFAVEMGQGASSKSGCFKFEDTNYNNLVCKDNNIKWLSDWI